VARGGMLRRFLLLAPALLAACAAPPPAEAPVPAAAYPPALRLSMCAGRVTGGAPGDPRWLSELKAKDVEAVLTAALERNGLAAPPGACLYRIDAELLGMTRPPFGLDMEATAQIAWTVAAPGAKPQLRLQEPASYTATLSDSAIGVVRLGRAGQGAVRVSILQLLERLRAVVIG